MAEDVLARGELHFDWLIHPILKISEVASISVVILSRHFCKHSACHYPLGLAHLGPLRSLCQDVGHAFRWRDKVGLIEHRLSRQSTL